MNSELVERIASAVLYEGYILYPYRPSAIKNQQRWNFGTLVPHGGADQSSMQTECLALGGAEVVIDVKVRFLQLLERDGKVWNDAVERAAPVYDLRLHELIENPMRQSFAFSGDIEVNLTISACSVNDGLFRITALIENTTALGQPVLLRSMVSTHTILEIRNGEFISLLDPPDQFRDEAGRCRNIATWPVLAGEEGTHDTLLSSPIILYDYPQVAPESSGDFFDGTEMDEMLTLRVLTLTDDEKQEMRDGDERARRILERTESLPAEHMLKLHGAVRGLRPMSEDPS
jgi:hypothetical protein